jgi:hypothetical protein
MTLFWPARTCARRSVARERVSRDERWPTVPNEFVSVRSIDAGDYLGTICPRVVFLGHGLTAVVQ